MKPLDYFYDTPAEGPGHYPQRFCTGLFNLFNFLFGRLFKFKAYGTENIAVSSSYLVAGNHRSYLDPIFVMMALRPRPMRYMAKEEFFKIPVVARLATYAGAFPVKRGSADIKVLKRAVAMLKRGELVGIFPEGTRGRGQSDEELQSRPAHEGVAAITHLAKCEVVPVHLWGTNMISPPGKRLWRFPCVTVCFGEPLSIYDERYASMDKHTRFAQFTDDVMAAIYALECPRDNEEAS